MSQPDVNPCGCGSIADLTTYKLETDIRYRVECANLGCMMTTQGSPDAYTCLKIWNNSNKPKGASE